MYKDLGIALLDFIGFIALFLFVIAIKGGLVWLIWEFAIVPTWGAGSMTFLQSCAISILCSVLTSSPIKAMKDAKKD